MYIFRIIVLHIFMEIKKFTNKLSTYIFIKKNNNKKHETILNLFVNFLFNQQPIE